ncbi:hypothetical protein SAMN02745823_02620 [Sporobacter termitidis DSM 10068]|uniref:Uncharacterized protein n=1 Tax=Sporobacter termitidis DSM 10068 TaxID=1123282 RepID=A0A1M5YLR9_9FIRM|nr:CBO0543 family protein [Sporobacter termitidis]SHI12794.1 hypothetical protein SAMN02745823_02620 [Sporobacter termitidis DSM 10068]
MDIEYILQYAAIAASVAALVIDRKGASKFVPVALFASFYANIVCFVALYFNWWNYPKALWGFVSDMSVTVNFIVAPAAAILWVKHTPDTAKGKFAWALVWTIGLTGVELILERFTAVIDYHNGYDWYYSFILWFASWYIWGAYHKWQIKKVLQWQKE